MNDTDLRPEALFDLSDPTTAAFFANCAYVWEALAHLEEHVARLTAGGTRIAGTVMSGAWLGDAPIVIEEGAVVEPGAYVVGPAYICLLYTSRCV